MTKEKEMDKIPTSELISSFNEDAITYVKQKRLKFLSEYKSSLLIKEDIISLTVRKNFADTCLYSPKLSLEEIIKLLNDKNILNNLTFSEQIYLIELLKKITAFLNALEKETLKKLDRTSVLLERGTYTFSSKHKLEYLKEENDRILSYWNFLNKIKISYEELYKTILASINYKLDVPEDILEGSILTKIKSLIIISSERKLVTPNLSSQMSELPSLEDLELISEEEKAKIKKLSLN